VDQRERRTLVAEPGRVARLTNDSYSNRSEIHEPGIMRPRAHHLGEVRQARIRS
jgi:hypothetical protein